MTIKHSQDSTTDLLPCYWPIPELHLGFTRGGKLVVDGELPVVLTAQQARELSAWLSKELFDE